MSRQQIRVGILGLGRAGWDLHARTAGNHACFTVSAVADPVAERLEEAAQKYECQTFERAEELIERAEVDLIVIATPSHTHGPLAIAAMQAGRHVLVEKPFAVSTAEAHAMRDAAAASGRVLACYQLRRLAPDFLKIKEVLASGVLGPIHQIRVSVHLYNRRRDWQTLRQFGGGMLNNSGAHFVDQVLHLVGGEWHTPFCDMRHVATAGDADDHLKLVFRGKDGIVADVELSDGAATPPEPHWTILGQYGALWGSMRELHWRYFDPTAVPERTAIAGTFERVYEGPEQLPWQEFQQTLGPNESSPQFYDRLYAQIAEDAPPLVPLQETVNLIELFDECRRQNGYLES